MNIKEHVDKLLNERAALLYGVKYDALDLLKQDEVLAEVVSGFDPRLVDLTDAMED